VLCAAYTAFDPQVLQRSPADRPVFIGGSLRHAQHYVTETLSNALHGLDRRCDLSCIRLVYVLPVSRLCDSSNFFKAALWEICRTTRVARNTVGRSP
jgi:hypothetical protein